MFFRLPPGPARLERPENPRRVAFEDFLLGVRLGKFGPLIPIEAVAAGDAQVVAAAETGVSRAAPFDLDVLADFASVESVIASAPVRAGRELPHIRELLMVSGAPQPDAETLRNLTGLETLWALPTSCNTRLPLDAVPAAQMRKLAVGHWFTKSMAPLAAMTGLTKLRLDLFREPLDDVSQMADLSYLHIKGPAKGWAKLGRCTQLEEAHLIEVQIANLRRWNNWQKLSVLVLSGRGVKSLAGLEACRALRRLTLLNLSMRDLSPVALLPELESLELRMAAEAPDLASVVRAPALQSFAIDSSAAENQVIRLPSVKILAEAQGLERLVLLETAVEDGDLMPLAELPRLRFLHLGSQIGADVEKLRAARPDIEIRYHPPDPKWAALREESGAVTIQKPGAGLTDWSIFQSLALVLHRATNYDAEKLIRGEIKKRDAALAKRLDWDTEAGAVGIYAKTEADIRTVAAIVNELVARASR